MAAILPATGRQTASVRFYIEIRETCRTIPVP